MGKCLWFLIENFFFSIFFPGIALFLLWDTSLCAKLLESISLITDSILLIFLGKEKNSVSVLSS